MRFSIITPTYNSSKTVLDTINSLYGQEFIQFESIIMDGGSTDETVEIIKNQNADVKIFSEKDLGTYDAINKGIDKSIGEIVGIINSDDFFISSTSLAELDQAFTLKKPDIVYGNVIYIDRDNIEKITRIWKPGKLKKWKIWFGWSMPHPAIFIRKDYYKKIGKYDKRFNVAADYDLILRIIKDKNVKIFYLNDLFIKMRTGGKSDLGVYSRLMNLHEVCMIFKKNFKIYPFWFFLTRPLSKLHQFFL